MVFLMTLGGAAARPLADPIVGQWQSGKAVITITEAGTGAFLGTVTTSYPSNNGCLHGAGQLVWRIRAAAQAGSYTGTNQGFADSPPACHHEAQSTVWTLTSPKALHVNILGKGEGDYTRSSGDTTPPTVTAIGSQGIYPRAVKLRFRVKDDSGKARAGAVVFQGKKPIWSHSAVSVVADGRLFWFSWKPPATFRAGAYISFCINAFDAAGNQDTDCAGLAILT